MATHSNLTPQTVKSAVDLSALQYFAGYIDSSGRLAAVTGADQRGVVLILNGPDAANKAALYQRASGAGVIVTIGAAVTAGDPLTNNAAGKFIKATIGQSIKAWAMEDGGADGNEIEADWVGASLVAAA